jgi:hypothetical protein
VVASILSSPVFKKDKKEEHEDGKEKERETTH